MLKKLAMVVGAAFLLLGVLGFVPGVTTTDDSGMQSLLGLFMVDWMHNSVHILTGVVALLAASSEMYAKWFFWIFGGIYALVAVIGFMDGSSVLGLFPVNMADNWLHVVFAVVLLGIGLMVKPMGMGSDSKPMGNQMPPTIPTKPTM